MSSQNDPVSTPCHWHHRLALPYLAFSMDVGDPTSGTPVHAANTLPTATLPTLPQPRTMIFKLSENRIYLFYLGKANNFWLMELFQIKKYYAIISVAAKRLGSEKLHKVYVLVLQPWVTHIHLCLLDTVRAETRRAREDAFPEIAMTHRLQD